MGKTLKGHISNRELKTSAHHPSRLSVTDSTYNPSAATSSFLLKSPATAQQLRRPVAAGSSGFRRLFFPPARLCGYCRQLSLLGFSLDRRLPRAFRRHSSISGDLGYLLPLIEQPHSDPPVASYLWATGSVGNRDHREGATPSSSAVFSFVGKISTFARVQSF